MAPISVIRMNEAVESVLGFDELAVIHLVLPGDVTSNLHNRGLSALVLVLQIEVVLVYDLLAFLERLIVLLFSKYLPFLCCYILLVSVHCLCNLNSVKLVKPVNHILHRLLISLKQLKPLKPLKQVESEMLNVSLIISPQNIMINLLRIQIRNGQSTNVGFIKWTATDDERERRS